MKLVLTKPTASPFLLLFVISILVCQQLESVVGQDVDAAINGLMIKKQSFVQMVRDTVVLLKKSRASSWDKIKAVVHDLQLQVSPPNLEGSSTTSDKKEEASVKEAVKTSIRTSKTKVEESAKAAGEVVHETASKVVKNDKQHTDEL